VQKKFFNLDYLIPILLGLASVTYIGGYSFYYLNSANIDWFVSGVSNSDLETHWLGWSFYRNAPFFQFPLLLNPNYGLGLNISLVHTDSIPLMSFLFKPFTSVLPQNFQYFGIWILLSTFLQSIFAYKTMKIFSKDVFICSVTTLFFLFAPIFYMRIFAQPAIGSQWLLIAALYLYLSPNTNYKRWFILSFFALMINGYLFAMVFGIYIAFVIKELMEKNINFTKLSLLIFGKFFFSLLLMWIVGYFSVGTGIQEGGFGFYKMNLNSFFDPMALYELHSRIMPDLPSPSVEDFGDYEGFAFLGIGVLFCILMALLSLVKSKIKFKTTSVAPLILISLVFIVFAISNKISFGNSILFEYKVPNLLDDITSTFRSSARFIWPVYYLIYVAVFAVLIKKFNLIKLRPFLTLVFLLQVYDTSLATDLIRLRMTNFDQHWGRVEKWSSPIVSIKWAAIARKYDKIFYVVPENKPDKYFPIAKFASENKMVTNFGYFSRRSLKKEEQIINNLRQSVLKLNFNPTAIYIFNDDELWEFALKNKNEFDLLDEIDGYRVLAPNYYFID